MSTHETERFCVVLLQNASDPEYNDFLGKFYHFPKKYLNLLSSPAIEFVYYEPSTKGRGVYFGCGKITRVFPDKREKDHYFAEIEQYHTFSQPVPFYSQTGEARESGRTYNAQNAVRRISPKTLDEISLDGQVVLGFKPDAHLIRVLGEQLIANEKVGILELIKNSYDANAKQCIVRIENVSSLKPLPISQYTQGNLSGPVIIVEDNGDGMTKSIIENAWLRPASTYKTTVKEAIRSQQQELTSSKDLAAYQRFISELKKARGGRLPLGEKGVGRFATHRLGSKLLITTKTAEDTYEHVLQIDWANFDSASGQSLDLEKVGVALTRQKPSRDYGPPNSGTRIVIYGGRPEYPLTSELILDIHRSIQKLQSPHHGPKDFDLQFVVPQLAAELDSTPIYEKFSPTFSFDAIVDRSGKADFDLEFHPPKSVPMPPEKITEKNYDFRLGDYWFDQNQNNKRIPTCGEFYIKIHVWYRTSPWIDGPDADAFKSYLDEFGGVSVYRDGMNIFPAEWGAVTDWLRLSKRHIKKGSHLSYYAMIGALELDQSKNIEIIDKTDRQGMLENTAFRDLTELVRGIVIFLENQYSGKRDQHSQLTKGLLRDPKQLSAVSRQSANILQKIGEHYDFTRDSLQLSEKNLPPEENRARIVNLEASLRTLQKSLDAMHEVQELLTEQAGFGLAIAVSVHEIAKLTSNFYLGITQLLTSKTFDLPKLEELRDSSAALKSELRRLAPLRAIRNERPTQFNASRTINFVINVFEAQIKSLGIQLQIEIDKDFSIFARYGAVNQVLNNLIDNSCYWLKRVPKSERKLTIKVDSKNREILVADNGPGIDQSIQPYIFQPGYSLKIPPSGLGLYISKYYMQTLGGDVHVTSAKNREHHLTGAQFSLDFGNVPEKKE